MRSLPEDFCAMTFKQLQGEEEVYGEIGNGDDLINKSPSLDQIMTKKQDTLTLQSIHELLKARLDDVEAKRMMHRIDEIIKE